MCSRDWILTLGLGLFYLRSLSLGCSSQLRKLGSLLPLLNLEDGGLYFRPWTLGPRTWESCAHNLRSKCALLPVKATSHFLYYYFFILNFFIIVIMFWLLVFISLFLFFFFLKPFSFLFFCIVLAFFFIFFFIVFVYISIKN